jgi:hypothetical protein
MAADKLLGIRDLRVNAQHFRVFYQPAGVAPYRSPRASRSSEGAAAL